jgi:hypothetical protein
MFTISKALFQNAKLTEFLLCCEHLTDEALVHEELLFETRQVCLDFTHIWQDGFLEIIDRYMESIF